MTAIDLGSNTIRFLDFDCETKEEKNSLEFVVRTAEGMHESGRIGEEALLRIITAIREARQAFPFSLPVKATATAAFRMAQNAREAVDRISHETGVHFEIIDAEREASLASLAVYEAANRLSPTPGLYIIDIGGASTEIMYRDGVAFRSLSFDIGIVTSANRFGDDEAALVTSLNEMVEQMSRFVRECDGTFGRPLRFAATAGTPTTLAAIKLGMNYASYDKARINGTVLTLRDIEESFAYLLGMDEAERETLVGSRRSDLVMCGIVIFRTILERLDFHECVVFDDGLREGIALNECNH